MTSRNGSGRVLLTGCAGFIGSRVAELLLGEGREVVGVDNLNDAYDPRLKEWRLARLRGRRGMRAEKLDITDAAAMRRLFEEGPGFDAVINLAARAGVRQSVENPWAYFETNVTGTLNLLELCRRFEVPKFVLASTSSLYGACPTQPFHEGLSTDGPLSPYAASKKAAEALCYTYHSLYGLDVTIPRYFTVYGPAGRPDMSLFRFVQWTFEERPVVVYGDGRQSRDFTYVEDIARGTCAALRPAGYEIMNLGSDQPIVLEDALHAVEKLTGKSARIVRHEAQAADVRATWADVSKAKRLLGWEPQVRFQDGIGQLVDWYRDNRSWASQVATG